ncbi:hypothetical protein BpHYR1_002001 [Brachionus plicatilis]|uniref:Uncharacterized protein n=1 Tax=Brachionus plicatilis TaxID=10195 RepID=A0A3M7SP18_BRAPC|nr:hypothetical protein BpHYR1_002001 [Brachionus plicatilis]
MSDDEYVPLELYESQESNSEEVEERNILIKRRDNADTGSEVVSKSLVEEELSISIVKSLAQMILHDEYRRSVESIIKQILNNEYKEYRFLSDLNNHQHNVIQELCTNNNLEHRTTGTRYRVMEILRSIDRSLPVSELRAISNVNIEYNQHVVQIVNQKTTLKSKKKVERPKKKNNLSIFIDFFYLFLD